MKGQKFDKNPYVSIFYSIDLDKDPYTRKC